MLQLNQNFILFKYELFDAIANTDEKPFIKIGCYYRKIIIIHFLKVKHRYILTETCQYVDFHISVIQLLRIRILKKGFFFHLY